MALNRHEANTMDMTNFIATTKLGRRLLATAAATLSLGVFAPGMASPAPAIVNGNVTTITAAPFTATVFMRMPNNQLGICAGSIVAQQWILTAAHCVSKFAPGDVKVSFGLTTITDAQTCAGKVRPGLPSQCANGRLVNKIVVNPSWNESTFNGDIALIKLDAPITTAAPIAMNASATAPAAGQTMNVHGWGITEAGTSSDQLRTGIVVNGRGTCANWGNAYFDPRYKLCGNGIRPFGAVVSTCTGDSGGPVEAVVAGKRQLVGIISYGPTPCADNNLPSLYTRVSAYVSWANATIAKG